MLQCDEVIHESENYTVDLKVNNFKNNLHHSANNIGISNMDLLSGCLYTNVDNTQEYPTI